MRGFERTPEKRRLYETAVRDVPYPVQVVWGADDPALRLSLQGQQAQHITGVETLHTLPAKHFLQEDQAPALADHIARHARAASALSRQRTLRAQSPPSSDDPPRAETPWREFRERGESLLAPKWSKQHTTLDG